MKYNDIIANEVGYHIDLTHASDDDKERFVTAFESQMPTMYENIFEQFIDEHGGAPEANDLFTEIVERVKMNVFDMDDLNQIAYAAGFTGVDK
jgi:hypothetical protein